MIFYFGNTGGGSGSVSVSGNGYVVNADGQLVGRDVVGVHPIEVLNPDGRSGPLTFRSVSQRVLAAGRIDGAVTTDQALTVYGAEHYIVRSVVFGRASAAPGEMMGGVYTGAGKTGVILAPATTTYEMLDAPVNLLEIAVDTGEVCTAPFLYVSLTDPNGEPITLDCWVLGDVLEYAGS